MRAEYLMRFIYPNMKSLSTKNIMNNDNLMEERTDDGSQLEAKASSSSANNLSVYSHKDGKLDQSELEKYQVQPDGYKEILASHPVKRWTRSRMLIYMSCLGIYFVSTTNGYDGSLLSSLITVERFTKKLGINTASSTGLVFSIFQIGQMCVAAFVWLGDFIGRKYTILSGSCIVIVGVIITAVANDSSTFMGGRFLLSFGSGLACSLSTSYLLEIVAPNERSVLCGIYNTLYYIGSIIATWSCYGTSKTFKDSDSAFRIPLWLQMLCPGLVVCLVAFAPESPRYNYMKGDEEKARKFFVKYHTNGDESHPLVEYEMAQLEMSLLAVPKLTIRDYFDIRVLFKSKAKIRSSLLVIAASWFGQFSGSNVVGYYITNLFEDLGISNPDTRILLNGVNSILGYIFATSGSLLVGKLGRRFAFIYANSGFVVSFAIIAACIAAHENYGNKAAGRAGIAFIYIFNNVFFAFGYTPLQPLYPAEISSSEMRAKGMALFQLVQGAAGFVNTYAAPVAMKNIKYWFYVFFVFWDLVELIIIYWCFVETKGLSLEEIELIFESEHPVRSSIILTKNNEASMAEKKRLTALKIEQAFHDDPERLSQIRSVEEKQESMV